MFNSFCWYLNVLHLSYVAALLRRIAFALPFLAHVESEYKDPEAVGGWRGYMEVPLFGVVAYRSWPDLKLHFRW